MERSDTDHTIVKLEPVFFGVRNYELFQEQCLYERQDLHWDLAGTKPPATHRFHRFALLNWT